MRRGVVTFWKLLGSFFKKIFFGLLVPIVSFGIKLWGWDVRIMSLHLCPLLVSLSIDENICIILNERQWSREVHASGTWTHNIGFLAMIILSQLLEFTPLSKWHFNRRKIQVIINRCKALSPKWLVWATSFYWQALFQKFENIMLLHYIFPLHKSKLTLGSFPIKFKTASLSKHIFISWDVRDGNISSFTG